MKFRSRLVAAGIATATMVAVSLATAAPAQAVPPTVPAIELPVGAGGDSSYLSEYGAQSPSSKVIPIGSATSSLEISPPFDPLYELACTLADATGAVVAERYWGEDEVGQSPPFVMTVPSGSVSLSGGPYVAECSSQSESTSRVRWTMTAAADAPATVVLRHDPQTYVRLTEYEPLDGGSYATDTPVALGERLRIRGAANAWFPAGSRYEVVTEISTGGGTAAGPAADVAITAAGDVVGLTIPVGIPAEPGESIGLSVQVTSTIPGTSTTPEQVLQRRWQTRLAVVEKATTQTALRLDRTLALSGRTTVRALVSVFAPDGQPITGTVTVFVDGKASGEVQVTGAGSASGVVRLPGLKRGLHSVVAVMGGTDSSRGSTSPSRLVRVLL
ncbi:MULTISPECIES: Ig-like domain-containing protein [unclassified Leifsonia]|uniref:Ig-like domain-containing protein n=1 Tax=unclassified Leifsonia TaxID=2663824 RepID=UPI0006F589AF|nr:MULTISPECIES: Ig-like domain-containing protein [unclassified Leifsonia]KQX06769.1 hypothetical protein ASC59_02765 [Leifsonia sp. Root1293]KRA11054.1 hypothetical protein ASD61_02765 [Leifsonia sp. Root60]